MEYVPFHPHMLSYLTTLHPLPPYILNSVISNLAYNPWSLYFYLLPSAFHENFPYNVFNQTILDNV